jgi:hypothetical protein
MDNKQFAKELEKRTRDFAVRIIRLSAVLPNAPEGKVVPFGSANGLLQFQL